jgi:chromosome segregation ATPase
MLTANKLEKIIELEDKLRAEYQSKLDAATAELDRTRQELADQRQQLQATIDRQLETITDLSEKATANHHVEQLNRELNNRSEKLQDEVGTLKKRVKTLQKELAEARDQIKALSQYDAQKMKKNLDANKKKLAEKTRANELLQQSLGKTKTENAELQNKLQELEAKLAAQEVGADGSEAENTEEKAA